MPQAAHYQLRKVGDRIRRLRRDRGISQEALADLAGLDRLTCPELNKEVRTLSCSSCLRWRKHSRFARGT